MKTRWWVVGLVEVALMSTGCGHKNVVEHPAPNSPPDPITATASVAASPTVRSAAMLSPQVNEPLPVPNLLPPTTVLERLPQVRVGRSDPFSVVPTAPIVVPAVTASAIAPVAVPPPTQLQTLPLTTVPAQALPLTQAAQPSPPRPQPIAPALAPTLLANAVEVMGVVQIGSQVSAIVQVPDESSSRYVRVGDYFANGRILVKQIEMVPHAEPRVIFVQDGVEVIRMVESAG